MSGIIIIVNPIIQNLKSRLFLVVSDPEELGVVEVGVDVGLDVELVVGVPGTVTIIS